MYLNIVEIIEEDPNVESLTLTLDVFKYIYTRAEEMDKESLTLTLDVFK